MKPIYIKRYWDEDNEMYYFHIENRNVIRQIVINYNSGSVVKLSQETTNFEEYVLCDQILNLVEWQDSEYISEAEFENIWNKK